MSKTTDILTGIRRTIKLYEGMLKDVCARYQLTQIEADIISFLYNNPDRDTAADIVELRMLSKGNVSWAVEQLIQKGLLRKEKDREDRRKSHLSLLEKSRPITEEIEKVKRAFWEQIFDGFTEEERKQYQAFQGRIQTNTKKAMERGGKE